MQQPCAFLPLQDAKHTACCQWHLVSRGVGQQQPAVKQDPHSKGHPPQALHHVLSSQTQKRWHWGVPKHLLAMVAWNSSTFCQCLPPKPTHFSTSGLLLSVAKLLVSGLCCEQDERANAAMKANFATKILEFFYWGLYQKLIVLSSSSAWQQDQAAGVEVDGNTIWVLSEYSSQALCIAKMWRWRAPDALRKHGMVSPLQYFSVWARHKVPQ